MLLDFTIEFAAGFQILSLLWETFFVEIKYPKNFWRITSHAHYLQAWASEKTIKLKLNSNIPRLDVILLRDNGSLSWLDAGCLSHMAVHCL